MAPDDTYQPPKPYTIEKIQNEPRIISPSQTPPTGPADPGANWPNFPLHPGFEKKNLPKER